MADISEEEAWEFSEMMLRTTPEINHDGIGFLTKRELALETAQAVDMGICEVAEPGPVYQSLRSASQ